MKREVDENGNIIIREVPRYDETRQWEPPSFYIHHPWSIDSYRVRLQAFLWQIEQYAPIIFASILLLFLASFAGLLIFSSWETEHDKFEKELAALAASSSQERSSEDWSAVSAVEESDNVNAVSERGSARRNPDGIGRMAAASIPRSMEDADRMADIPAPGSIMNVLSEPEGATVLVDFDSIGTTPARVRLGTGVYIVSVAFDEGDRRDSLIILEKPSSRTVTFSRDGSASNDDLIASRVANRVAASGMVMAGSFEAPTRVEAPTPVSDVESGPSTDRPAEPGNAEGANDSQDRVESARAAPATATASESTGELVVTSEPAGASVAIDGVVRGRTPLFLPDVTSGSYDVRVEMEGYESAAERVDVSPADRAVIRHDLEPLMGTLAVLVKPWGSIYINDALHVRNTDLRYTVALASGSHRIRVEHPTLGRRDVEVNVAPGEARDVVIDLTGTVSDASR